MTAKLRARGVQRDYGGLVALHHLDLTVTAAERVALVGANGAGKTTLLLLVAGLLEPTDGDISICGHEAGSMGARAALSYLPDTPALYDDLSLIEHLEYVARLHGVADWEGRATGLIERLGLQEQRDRLPRSFSRGMRQKASIALALVRPFELLVADEPYDGLDPPSRDALEALLTEAVAHGSAVVVSTHRSDVVESSTRCVVLRDGHLIFDGAPHAAPPL